jgi:hypothetical protein
MNRITKTLAVAGLVLPIIISSCKKETLPDNKSILSSQHNEGKADKNRLKRLVEGLAGSLGSTIGVGGDLFVPDPVAGAILRIDPKTGDYKTFAGGLPQLIPEVGLGGITDVAFLCGKAYALVTMVDDPNLFPTGQINGIYRIDGPNSFKVIADIGAYNIAHPPTGFDFFVSTGVLYSIQTYHGGFLVTDGHLNRVLHVTLDGKITLFRKFDDIVPTGLAVRDNHVYMAEAGPVPHLPENGKVVSFSRNSPVKNIASGAPMLVDVEFGCDQVLFALSQGIFGGGDPGSPALPNTGSLVRVKADGTFSVIVDKLDRPTSFELIGNTAYIVTLTGEIWTVDNIADPPYGRVHQKHLLHHHE